MVLDDLRRRKSQPLIHADVGVSGCQQHLKVHKIFRACVFEVVCFSGWDIAYITSREVERARRFWCFVDCETCGAGEDVIPLIGGGMPVKLSDDIR